MSVYASLIVVEPDSSKLDEISLADAARLNSQTQTGDEIELDGTPGGYKHAAARNAIRALIDGARHRFSSTRLRCPAPTYDFNFI
jgi:hypothetical protein